MRCVNPHAPSVFAIDPVSVRFRDRDLERAFRKYSLRRDTTTDQLVLISGMVIFLAYGILDWFTLGDVAPWVIALRLIMTPSTVALIIWTYTAKGRRHIQTVSTLIIGGAGVSIGLMIHAAGSVSPPYYVGMLHVAIVFSSLSRVNFRICCGVLAVIYSSFFVATLGFEPGPDLLSGHFFLVSILVSCAMVTWFLERNRRREFLDARDKEHYFNEVVRMADEAARSVRRKNALLNVLGHVVKTPLHQIIGYAQIIEQADRLPAAERDTPAFAAEIHRAGIALTHQSQRILDYSRADAGLLSAQPQSTTPRRLVREALHRHEAAMRTKKITLALDVTDTPVRIDHRHIGRALDELIDNAVRYVPPGSTISIHSRAEVDRAVIAISDQGPGIAEGDIDRIGDAFGRTEEFRNMGGDKLGIGVSLSHILCRVGGGTLYLASIPDVGTLAQICLPLDTEQAAKPAPLARAS